MFFFLKHDNNPQIPNNNVIESLKNPPVFTILFSIKMSNFHEQLCVCVCVCARARVCTCVWYSSVTQYTVTKYIYSRSAQPLGTSGTVWKDEFLSRTDVFNIVFFFVRLELWFQDNKE